jgi:hypothetical protein
VAVLPAESLAVTVIVLLPLDKVMAEIDQLAVPLAVPLAPLSLVQIISLMPLPLSVALPDRVMLELVAV